MFDSPSSRPASECRNRNILGATWTAHASESGFNLYCSPYPNECIFLLALCRNSSHLFFFFTTGSNLQYHIAILFGNRSGCFNHGLPQLCSNTGRFRCKEGIRVQTHLPPKKLSPNSGLMHKCCCSSASFPGRKHWSPSGSSSAVWCACCSC